MSESLRDRIAADATITPQEIADQLKRLADFVLQVGKVW